MLVKSDNFRYFCTRLGYEKFIYQCHLNTKLQEQNTKNFPVLIDVLWKLKRYREQDGVYLSLFRWCYYLFKSQKWVYNIHRSKFILWKYTSISIILFDTHPLCGKFISFSFAIISNKYFVTVFFKDRFESVLEIMN